MIDTVLNLARLVKESKEAISCHLFSSKCPYGSGNSKFQEMYFFQEIRVTKSYKFVPSGTEKDSFLGAYSIFYRNSSADTGSPSEYIFGDIKVEKKENEIKGNFIFDLTDKNPDSNSFMLAEENLFKGQVIEHDVIRKFRKAFKDQIDIIKDIIKNTPFTDKQKYLFIHFNFGDFDIFNNPKNAHWYEFEGALEYMDQMKLQSLTKVFDETPYGLVLNNSFIGSLCSGDDKNDEQSPEFSYANRYKCFTIPKKDVGLLYYIEGVSSCCEISIPKCSPYMLRILPKGNISYKDFKSFIDNMPKYITEEDNKEEKAESVIQEAKLEKEWLEDAFNPPPPNIISFDFIFFMKGGTTSPNVDMLEINNVQRSQLLKLMTKIKDIRRSLITETGWYPDSLWKCFHSILTITEDAKNQPRYKAHMLKVLPKIFKDNYYTDPALLGYMIEKILYNIRNDKPYIFKKLFINFTFLTLIQKEGRTRMMSLKTSKSAELGRLAARIVFSLSTVKKSVEKRFVGFLSRRVLNIESVVKLLNMCRSQAMLHKDELKIDTKSFPKAMELVEELGDTYDKEAFMAGFLSEYDKLSYFENEKTKNNN
jgi:hypothetical protein